MNITREPFELSNQDGDPIRGDVWTSEEPRPGTAIVICHGFKGFKDWGFFPYLSEQLVRRTLYPVIAFNFSGNGIGADLENFTELDKFERNTFSKELDDLGIVIDAAGAGELPSLDPRHTFGLLGHSRGGGTVIIKAAADPRVICLVTWSAIAYVNRWTDEQKREWRLNGRIEVLNARTGQMMPLGLELLEDVEQNCERLDILKAASRLVVPYLIIHGAEDESVSVTDGERIAEVAPSIRSHFQRIEGAGHTFGAAHPFEGPTDYLTQVVDLSADWFVKHLDE